MFSIEMLPAAHGDSLWIEYGSASSVRRILIDGGPAHTYEKGLRLKLSAAPPDSRVFELMVVTHIDADHIDGSLILLQDKKLNIQIKEFWFNGWRQLSKLSGDTLAELQGEFLGGLLTKDPKLGQVWNRQFDGKAVVVPDNGILPEIKLEGGARITLLGPTSVELNRLRARWSSAIRDFTPGDTDEALRRLRERREYKAPEAPAIFAARQYGDDRSPANGSSISFLLEYGGVSILLAGDAHARTLAGGLRKLAEQRSVSRIRLDAIKLPHHGSMGNVSEEWLRLVDCDRWLISTNGAVFNHPDLETAQLIAQHSKNPKYFCNYESDTTRQLKSPVGRGKWTTVFPEKNQAAKKAGGLVVSLPDREFAKPARSNRKTGRAPGLPKKKSRNVKSRRKKETVK